jgi:ubiquinone/menaquinone biosynthesis C-methylase UbiE
MKKQDILSQIPREYSSGFVLEIGAGPTPYAHTDVIVDKYPFDNFERSSDILQTALVVKGDATCLPLPDKSVDLLFLSHVIEHIDDPAAFLAEAQRVSRYIYLEWPSIIREVIYGWSFHKWVIEVHGNEMIFYRNDLPQLCGGSFHNESDSFFNEYIFRHHDKYNFHFMGPVDNLRFTVSDMTAYEYLSCRNSEKVNFSSISAEEAKADKLTEGILHMLASNLLPKWMKEKIKSLTGNNLPAAMERHDEQTFLDRLKCLSCGGRIDPSSLRCKCGFSFRRINGLLSIDPDDYQLKQ